MPRVPLSDRTLTAYAKEYKIPNFIGVFMRDELITKRMQPKTNECAIVNLDNSNNKGTHWVCYVKNKNNILYFDSIGNLRPPQELIKYLGNNINLYYNYNRRQRVNSVICGHLCLKFLLETTK